MAVAQVLATATRRLRDAGHESARLEAEVLLAYVLHADRAKLYVDLLRPLEKSELMAFEVLLERHLNDEPVAYIVGAREFFGLRFLVDKRTLVPRPETELLVEKAIQIARRREGGRLTIVDVGTGSGAIAISLSVTLPEARVYGIDVSEGCLEVAAMNCRAHGVEDRVELLLGDLLTPLPEPADIVIANLPYIPSAGMATLPADVVGYEPTTALDGGHDGLEIYRRLLRQLPAKIAPGGHVLLEIAAYQGATMAESAARIFPGVDVRVDKDYGGLDRIVSFQMA